MHIKIYYMTGTGNSKRASKLVQLQLNSMNHQCEIFNWIHEEFESWDSAGTFGFIAPVHSFREPSPFQRKLKNLPSYEKEPKKPVFIISCCEAMTGNFYKRVAKILKKKNTNVVGIKTYYAPSNVLMWERSFGRTQKVVDPVKDNSVLQFAKNLPELIEKNEHYKVKGSILWGFAAVMVKDWNLRVMVKRKIEVDESKCKKCGICARDCMGQCIELKPFPVFNMKKCCVCLGCINLCSNNALDAKNTIGKMRYKGLGKVNVQPL